MKKNVLKQVIVMPRTRQIVLKIKIGDCEVSSEVEFEMNDY